MHSIGIKDTIQCLKLKQDSLMKMSPTGCKADSGSLARLQWSSVVQTLIM